MVRVGSLEQRDLVLTRAACILLGIEVDPLPWRFKPVTLRGEDAVRALAELAKIRMYLEDEIRIGKDRTDSEPATIA